MVKQPGHLTSMKKERGPGTRVCHLTVRTWLCRCDAVACVWGGLYLQLVLAGLGLGGRVEEIDGENLRRYRVSN